MNGQNGMMQHMFRVQIAMLAHGVVAGYRKVMGMEPMPPFSDLGAAEQDELLENVDFWLANPSAPIAASHEAWLARGISEGWRLGEALDNLAKLSPFIRPFDTLPKDMVVMEHLFRAAVDSVTRAGNELPEYRRRIERINAAITRIDRIRGLELHQAARALSPDLSNLGLHGALRDLMRIYEPAMEASIHVAPEVIQVSPPIATQVLLACYRIVEQSVLNSVVHGQATEVVISVTVPSETAVSIEVTDNGTGDAQTDNARGFGSAVLDSWCRVLGGSWSLEYPPGGGARLMATLSLKSSSDFDLPGVDVSLQ